MDFNLAYKIFENFLSFYDFYNIWSKLDEKSKICLTIASGPPKKLRSRQFDVNTSPLHCSLATHTAAVICLNQRVCTPILNKMIKQPSYEFPDPLIILKRIQVARKTNKAISWSYTKMKKVTKISRKWLFKNFRPVYRLSKSKITYHFEVDDCILKLKSLI